MKYFFLKENSFVAKLAAKKLRTSNVAIVFGRTIYIYGVSEQDFLGDRRWLCHELKHIEQYERLGHIRFIAKYLWQSMRVGYYKCNLECEAREAENDESLLYKYILKKAV